MGTGIRYKIEKINGTDRGSFFPTYPIKGYSDNMSATTAIAVTAKAAKINSPKLSLHIFIEDLSLSGIFTQLQLFSSAMLSPPLTRCSTSYAQEIAKLYRKLFNFKNPYLLMRIVEADTLRVLASQFLSNHFFLQKRLDYKALFSNLKLTKAVPYKNIIGGI